MTPAEMSGQIAQDEARDALFEEMIDLVIKYRSEMGLDASELRGALGAALEIAGAVDADMAADRAAGADA